MEVKPAPLPQWNAFFSKILEYLKAFTRKS